MVRGKASKTRGKTGRQLASPGDSDSESDENMAMIGKIVEEQARKDVGKVKALAASFKKQLQERVEEACETVREGSLSESLAQAIRAMSSDADQCAHQAAKAAAEFRAKRQESALQVERKLAEVDALRQALASADAELAQLNRQLDQQQDAANNLGPDDAQLAQVEEAFRPHLRQLEQLARWLEAA